MAISKPSHRDAEASAKPRSLQDLWLRRSHPASHHPQQGKQPEHDLNTSLASDPSLDTSVWPWQCHAHNKTSRKRLEWRGFYFFLPVSWCLTCSRCNSPTNRDGKVVCSRAQSQALTEVLCHEVFSPVWAQRWDKCMLQVPWDRPQTPRPLSPRPPGPHPHTKESVGCAVPAAMLS